MLAYAVPPPPATVFHPAKVYPARVNVFAVKLVATFATWSAIDPVPPLELNDTV